MIKPRVIETNDGIQEQPTVREFDQMARSQRDKGQIDYTALIKNGLTNGAGLEIGPGPGYVGLEWLKMTQGTSLVGLEISEEMIKMAAKNAAEYGFENRVRYIQSNATERFPFNSNTFDAVFSYSSLHEWEKPENVFNEIHRVLKTGGHFLVSDLRRDVSFFIRQIMKAAVKQPSMKAGLLTSLAAAYTKDEINKILSETKLNTFQIVKSPFGMYVTGEKK